MQDLMIQEIFKIKSSSISGNGNGLLFDLQIHGLFSYDGLLKFKINSNFDSIMTHRPYFIILVQNFKLNQKQLDLEWVS